MMRMMREAVLPAIALLLCSALVFAVTGAVITNTMPPYRDSVSEETAVEKIVGLRLIVQSAAREDNLTVFGSSELRTTEIPTHPANFFAGKRSGFQINLVGRGSCQSLIHALQIAASGDSFSGKKVVLITSPQSYLPQGIAPDLFMANFSPQQYLTLLEDEGLSTELKADISARVAQLLTRYCELPDAAATDPALRLKAKHTATPGFASGLLDAALTPYYAFSRYLYDLKGKVDARRLLSDGGASLLSQGTAEIDWEMQEQAAVAAAQSMSANNDFGMLDDYYTTYIGTRLERWKDRDAELDYSVSEEYTDLRLLFEVCRQKGIEPLFIHVPLHGQWSDYTGFTAGRRQAYYENVRAIAEEYGIETLDLTGHEYEQYFMCDTMHLGWKGWLEVDKALIDYYYK